MNIQGELDISLKQQTDKVGKLNCQITSSRPLRVAELFSGKTIEHTLNTIPLIFSICSKAQSVTVIRAIESATNTPTSNHIESNREALIALESLREQSLRILIDWPTHLNEESDNAHLAHVAMGINQLIQSLEPEASLSFPAKAISLSISHKQAWVNFSNKLSNALFSTTADQWIENLLVANSTSNDNPLENWSENQTTQSSRFIHWLNHQDWKDAGSSTISNLPKIDDHDLIKRLTSDKENFTSLPEWNGKNYELSWFSRQQNNSDTVISQLSNQLLKQHGNGIFTRMTARLLEVARLLEQLDKYFIKNTLLKALTSNQEGLAHSNAARGKLSHYVEVEDSIINRLIILAPTEWNFHPQGVAADSLSHLQLDSLQTKNDITKQAELMIHAIDPCVGYQLHIHMDDPKNRVVH